MINFSVLQREGGSKIHSKVSWSVQIAVLCCGCQLAAGSAVWQTWTGGLCSCLIVVLVLHRQFKSSCKSFQGGGGGREGGTHSLYRGVGGPQRFTLKFHSKITRCGGREGEVWEQFQLL